jgi:hypothetical protein
MGFPIKSIPTRPKPILGSTTVIDVVNMGTDMYNTKSGTQGFRYRLLIGEGRDPVRWRLGMGALPAVGLRQSPVRSLPARRWCTHPYMASLSRLWTSVTGPMT